MPDRLTADAVAIAAAHLTLATVQASVPSGQLEGLSAPDGPAGEVERIFDKMTKLVQAAFAAPPAEQRSSVDVNC